MKRHNVTVRVDTINSLPHGAVNIGDTIIAKKGTYLVVSKWKAFWLQFNSKVSARLRYYPNGDFWAVKIASEMETLRGKTR